MTTKEQRIEKMDRALELRKELSDIANFFAGDETGWIAVTLHQACSAILKASDMLEDYES